MKYSKKEIGEKFKHELNRGYNIEKIAHWASDLYFSSRGNFPKEINDILRHISLMDAGPEADCQIALFYDPCLHVVANVHAGWRGSVANIYAEAIQRMHQVFGCQPSNLLVCISPSLGPDEAEFIHYRSELPQEFWPFQVRPNYFDFWSISEYQLQAAGILPHHIEIARLSTYANPRDFFCYRRDKITGRHSTCITLNPSQ